MKPVFLDTSGLIAVVNTDDQWHGRAEAAWRDLAASNAPLVTTPLVLIEMWDGLSRVDQRPLAVDLYDRLCRSPRVRILAVASEQELAAWQLCRQRPDKNWGVTDCASFVVMSQLGMEEAFTVDRHFEQASFRRLIHD
jgi:uncharacterized protein